MSSYTRRPATSFLRVLTHINTRYVYTGTTPAFVAVFTVRSSGSSSFPRPPRPPRRRAPLTLLRPSPLPPRAPFVSRCSVFPPKYFFGRPSAPSAWPLSSLPIFPANGDRSSREGPAHSHVMVIFENPSRGIRWRLVPLMMIGEDTDTQLILRITLLIVMLSRRSGAFKRRRYLIIFNRS